MIEISHLVKRFGALQAVDDLSLTLVPGEILGFLGPNGAGKSTTMKMLTGYLTPTSGTVRVYGHDVSSDPIAAQAMMGYLPEGAPCYDEMTPLGFLDFIASIRGYSGAEKQHRIKDVVQKMALESVLQQKIETLSKGFKRRVGLAQAIIHDPSVLILDEPTDGLDPNQKHQVRSLIQGLSKDKIVIISTHILEEVTAVCNRVVIVANGKIAADCTPLELEQKSRFHGAVTLELDTADIGNESLQAEIAALDVVASIEVAENSLHILPAGDNPMLPGLLKTLSARQVVPVNILSDRGRLDEVFRQITMGGTP